MECVFINEDQRKCNRTDTYLEGVADLGQWRI